jgi:long-chain acyl-CoA synthetase
MQPVSRLFEIPLHQLQTRPLEKSLVTKRAGQWVATSTQEFVDQAHAVSRGLLRLGVQPDDKIALISMTNRSEWNVLDIGILQLGAQDVPIYPTITSEDYEYILNHCEAKYCFVSCQEVFAKIDAIADQIPSLRGVYSFDQVPGCKHWHELLQLGADESNQAEVEQRKSQVMPAGMATLIYTSGTTGRPKGVMLSHQNIVSNVQAVSENVPLVPGQSVALSFLPVCHIFERMLHYTYMFHGVEIHFAESLETIPQNLLEVKPTVMSVVPRLLEKMYDRIMSEAAKLSKLKKRVFAWALELGKEYEPYGQNGPRYERQLALARRLVFSKWRAGFGGRLEHIASGSAALQPRLTRVFNAAGMQVMEGYGLTETSPVVTSNVMENNGFRIGTVGKAIPGTEIKIAADGEICVKGPQVMMGYFKEPEMTAEVIKDGFFHTGDLGQIDADGFLKITGRKKEMFKTSGGKYVAPQLLENRLKQSSFIEQVMVVGEGEKMPAALIQPEFEFLRQWAAQHGINTAENADLIGHPQVIARIKQEIEEANESFAKWEQVKDFRLTPDIWTSAAGHLTPTLKMRREIIQQKYQQLYDQMYGAHS